MRLVTANGLRSEARVVSEPAHVYRMVESLVGWRSERRGGVQNRFRILFVANDDACSVGVGFGE